MKIFNSIFGKISIGITLTAVIIIAVIGIVSSNKINQGFDTYLLQQEREIGEQGIGRQASSEEKETRHELLINEFKVTVFQSIIVASIIGTLIAFLVSLLISKQITKPLKNLKNEVKKLSENEYHEISLRKNPKEIKELIVEFNLLINELNRVEDLREDLVSDVTHELKTPLTKIVGQIEGCLDGVYKCDKDHLKKILNNANQLETLISQLQELVEIKANQVKLNIQEIELKSFVNDVITGYEKDGIEIIVEIADSIKISADPNRLREILDNLINNAIRYTSEGRITILFLDNQLIISDTGNGIPEKDLPYIFERFYRADKSRNRKTGGLGLGLSIVKELVEIHGWSIRIKSTLNVGTKVTISFDKLS